MQTTEFVPASGPDPIQEKFLAQHAEKFEIFRAHEQAVRNAASAYASLQGRLREVKAQHEEFAAVLPGYQEINFARTVFENVAKDVNGVKALEVISRQFTTAFFLSTVVADVLKLSAARVAQVQSDFDAFISTNRDLLKEGGIKI